MIPIQEDSHNETYPMVSVIIPAKNEANNLTRCLKSLTNIDYPKECFEIILVDNGSTDNTVQIAEDYGVRALIHPELRISGLRNVGASVAGGGLLAFVDADVVVSKDWLSSAVGCLNRNPGAGCVGSFPLPPDESGWVAKSWWFLQIPKSVRSDEQVNWLPSMNIVVRKEAFEFVRGFNPNLITSEDVDFCYRLGSKYKIVYCHKMEAIHYGEPKSLNELFKKERWRGTSNYDGLRVHGFRIDELPSLLLPIYYLVLTVSFIIAAITCRWGFLTLNVICWFVPPAIKSYLAASRNSKFNLFPEMILCYLVYCLARSAALLDWVIGKGRHRKRIW